MNVLKKIETAFPGSTVGVSSTGVLTVQWDGKEATVALTGEGGYGDDTGLIIVALKRLFREMDEDAAKSKPKPKPHQQMKYGGR